MFKSSFFFRLILILVGTSGLSFAQSSVRPDQDQPAQIAGMSGTGSQSTPALQERHPRYQVEPSDVLAISFPLSIELNQTVTVQPDGFITLANVGSIHVQGNTVPQIVEILTKAYANILHNPIIGVDLTSFQPPQFTASGQVGKPGQYNLRADTTVMQGIAVAGGFLPTAKSQVFLFHRVSSDLVEIKKLNTAKLTHAKNANEDVHLQPGDMIFVPETLISKFRKYVPYTTGVFLNPSSILF